MYQVGLEEQDLRVKQSPADVLKVFLDLTSHAKIEHCVNLIDQDRLQIRRRSKKSIGTPPFGSYKLAILNKIRGNPYYYHLSHYLLRQRDSIEKDFRGQELDCRHKSLDKILDLRSPVVLQTSSAEG